MITITGGQVSAGQISSAGAADGQVATADGAGGVAWEGLPAAGGGILATGATVGATSQRQVFTNGIGGPSWRPSADSVTALQLQNAAGTNVLNVDTTNVRVGIGTASPANKLHVVSTGQIPLAIDGANSVTTDIRYAVGPIIANTNVTTNNWGGVLFSGVSGSNAFAGVGGQITDRTNNYGDLVLATKGGGTLTEWVRITGAGNVGIGTVAPTAALHVPASTTARASLRVPDGTAPTAPNTGDVWAAGGKLYYYNGATTKEIAFV